jgi:hypothetical protein
MRPAPSAARSASSFCRDAARESSRLATFAQAIRSTKATAAKRNEQDRRISPDNLFMHRHHRWTPQRIPGGTPVELFGNAG